MGRRIWGRESDSSLEEHLWLKSASCRSDLQQQEGIRSYTLLTYTQMIHFTPSVREKILLLSLPLQRCLSPRNHRALAAAPVSEGSDSGCARSPPEPPPHLLGALPAAHPLLRVASRFLPLLCRRWPKQHIWAMPTSCISVCNSLFYALCLLF